MKLGIKQLLGGITAFLILFSMVWAGNEYVAKQKDLIELENCMIAWRLEDKAYTIQKRIWFLESTYRCPACPNHLSEYRRLKYELKIIMEKLRSYLDQGTGKGREV